MGMNEADTRYHLIDPVLRDKGYVKVVDDRTPAQVIACIESHGLMVSQALSRLKDLLGGRTAAPAVAVVSK